MIALRRRIVLAAAAATLAAGPALAGVPADAISGDMSLGNPKAPVKVEEYASAACPHCAHFNEAYFPEFRKKYVDTGRVYYTLKEFVTPPAEAAAAGFLVARCGGRAKYFTILDQVFRSQTRWTVGNIGQVISEVGMANGLTLDQVNSCLTDEKALDAFNARTDAHESKEDVDSTPTFKVNGRKIAGVTLADLDKAIAEAGGKATGSPARKPAKTR